MPNSDMKIFYVLRRFDVYDPVDDLVREVTSCIKSSLNTVRKLRQVQKRGVHHTILLYVEQNAMRFSDIRIAKSQ